jgi:hypothetical protein
VGEVRDQPAGAGAQDARCGEAKRDADAVFALGEDIDMACEDCHLEYWYPNDSRREGCAIQAKADREKERQQKAAEAQKK